MKTDKSNKSSDKSSGGFDSLGKSVREHLMVVVLAVAGIVAAILMTGCDTPAADAALAEWQTRTAAVMAEAGIDAKAASVEDWHRYGAQVAQEMLHEDGGSLPEPDESPMPWWALAGELAGTYFGVKGAGLLVQSAVGAVRGKKNRATENLGVALSPESSWRDTLKAIAALSLDTHSPKAESSDKVVA